MASNFLVIFDLDGTLVHSNINYEQIRNEVKGILAKILTPEEYKQVVSVPRSILELLLIVQKHDTTQNELKRAWKIIEHYETLGYEDATIKEDVVPTLDKLKKEGYKIAILTNNSRKLTEYALNKFELLPYIDAVITRDDITQRKPHPEGIYKLMNQFNANPQTTLFIGDSWLDCEAALKAKINFAYLGHDKASVTREKNYSEIPIIMEIRDVLKLLNLEDK